LQTGSTLRSDCRVPTESTTRECPYVLPFATGRSLPTTPSRTVNASKRGARTRLPWTDGPLHSANSLPMWPPKRRKVGAEMKKMPASDYYCCAPVTSALAPRVPAPAAWACPDAARMMCPNSTATNKPNAGNRHLMKTLELPLSADAGVKLCPVTLSRSASSSQINPASSARTFAEGSGAARSSLPSAGAATRGHHGVRARRISRRRAIIHPRRPRSTPRRWFRGGSFCAVSQGH
jgi:hypothetical protein